MLSFSQHCTKEKKHRAQVSTAGNMFTVIDSTVCSGCGHCAPHTCGCYLVPAGGARVEQPVCTEPR